MAFKKSIKMDTQVSEKSTSDSNESVNISKAEFETLMRRLNAVEKEDQTVTSQSQFKRYSGLKSYSFKIMDGKPIIHLVMTRNVVRKNLATNGWNEDQRIMVTYADETEEEMTYDDFAQQYVFSDKFTPISEEHKLKVYFKDTLRKPEIVSDGDFKTRYMTITENGTPIINHDIVKKADNLDYYTFRIDEVDEDGNKTIFD